jgi:endonuclease/exonuclease/phosphatase (EEP) superfamily protein YafD
MQNAEMIDEWSKITQRLAEHARPRWPDRVAVPWTVLRWGMIALPWMYLGVLLLVWATLRFFADRWWPATLLLFGPRWIYPLPLLILIPLCLLWDRRRWPILLASAAILVFPIMGFCLPWGRMSAPEGTRYHVLTCNMHDGEGDPVALHDLILREKPDFIALQECELAEVQFALEGYQIQYSNRLLVASLFPLHEVGNTMGPEPPHAYPRMHALICAADTPTGEVIVGSVHLSSPRNGLSSLLDRKKGIDASRKAFLEDNVRYRSEESAAIKRMVEQSSAPVILAGDFNTPVESAIYRENWGGFQNAFSQTGFGFGRTFASQVRGIPFGVRIDHILGSGRSTPVGCWIGPSIGSEHLPVLADMICE